MNKLEKQVLQMIGEDPNNPDVFTDDDAGMDQIRTSISDGISEVLMQTGGWTEVFRIPLVQDQTFYKIELANSDVGWFQSVFNVETETALTQTSLISLNAFDPLWMRYTGPPTQYLPVGTNAIAICPKSSASAGVLECHIAAIPRRYQTDKDRIKLKNIYERSVVDYAVAEYWASRGSAKDAAEHLRRFATSIGMQRTYGNDAGKTYQYSINKDSNEDITLTP
tara:strand:- start:334 stop:1002 length:669 start_codon:yes stop_codon:yes gene_type:complete